MSIHEKPAPGTSAAAAAAAADLASSIAENTHHQVFVDTALDFTEKLVSPFEISEALYELAERLTALLALAGSGVILESDSRLQAATAVPRALLQLENYQVEHQEGPCVFAHQSGELQVVTDLRQERAWPGYRQIAAQVGVRAVVGIPLKLAGVSIGAINLYNTDAREWSRVDLRSAMVMTNIATAYLLSSTALTKQTELSVQLQHALDSRVLVEQAKGVLAEADGISVEAAYQLLRRYARNGGLRVHDVACAIIDRTLTL